MIWSLLCKNPLSGCGDMGCFKVSKHYNVSATHVYTISIGAPGMAPNM